MLTIRKSSRRRPGINNDHRPRPRTTCLAATR